VIQVGVLSVNGSVFGGVDVDEPLGVGLFVLGLMFVWSGIAKARRPTLAALAMNEFGLTSGLNRRLAVALGASEIALGVALGSTVLPRLSLAVSSAALWLFAFLIARSLRRGDRFACFCFGNADASISSMTLLRALGLALLSTLLFVVAVAGAEPPTEANAVMLEFVVAMALVGTTVLVAQTVRSLHLARTLDPVRK
jgi:hypothetical protein